MVIAKEVDEKCTIFFTLFTNIQILEQYLSTFPKKNFHDHKYYPSKENIRNLCWKLACDIDWREIDTSLKETIIFIIYEKVQYE